MAAMTRRLTGFCGRKAVYFIASVLLMFLVWENFGYVFKSQRQVPVVSSPAPVWTAKPDTVKMETPRPANRSATFTLDNATTVQWQGFGPEKGQYNFTVVTAMFDIGRGEWQNQTRKYTTYLRNMKPVLALDINIVVFVDAKARPFVEWMRRGRESRTRVVELRLKDLPYYSYRERILEIMKSDKYRKDNELVKHHLCESQIPEYNIIQWSKMYFLNEAIEANPYHTDFFLWIDGGYGHGNNVLPNDGVWRPKNVFEYPNRVTFIERSPVERYRNQQDRLHKLSINILAGLFFGGGKDAVQRMYRMQQELLARWMKDGVQDDDQTVYMLLYFKQPDLFHLVRADWYDVFRKFN